jgi:hypothetical protein
MLPDADPSKERGSYSVGVADKPATDAMEEGGQYQRLLIAVVIFVCELGAFVLLGALSVGVILAQVLLLLWLAFAPVALVFAVIPGRGHDFFRGWLTRLAGLLLRKAAYSLILAVLLAVNAALASATSQLGWLMSFGLQGIFFWAVFFQRRQLTTACSGPRSGGRRPATPTRVACSPTTTAPAREDASPGERPAVCAAGSREARDDRPAVTRRTADRRGRAARRVLDRRRDPRLRRPRAAPPAGR